MIVYSVAAFHLAFARWSALSVCDCLLCGCISPCLCKIVGSECVCAGCCRIVFACNCDHDYVQLESRLYSACSTGVARTNVYCDCKVIVVIDR